MTALTTETVPSISATAAVTEALLADVVERLARQRERWEPLVRLDAGERTWAKIPVPEGLDVWVIAWGTFQRTELHSHDDATAAFTTVAGVVTEIRPDSRGRLIPRKIPPGLTQVVAPGEIHDVRNEHVTPAVTIHAYAPRLTSMTYYRWDQGQVVQDRVVHASDAEARVW